MSYGGFAASLGRPPEARAVGHANGANYGGSLERKRWLLRHEAGASVAAA